MCYCPTPTLHLNLALTGDGAFLLSLKKNSLCMIYKRFKLWGHWKCPHKSPSPCNTCHTHVIIHTCVLKPHTRTHTHNTTHTRASTLNTIQQYNTIFLWILGTFHRLLLLLHQLNNIFYLLNLNLPFTENLFAFLHFQINIIYYFNP